VRLTTVAAVASVALVASLGLRAHDRGLAAAAYIVLMAALALVALVRELDQRQPSAARLLHARRRPREPEPPRPAQLDWLERQLAVAGDSALELRIGLRPLVAQIASASLARRHGVVLERRPERARELLGPTLWALLGDDQPAPERHEPGLAPEELRRLIEELEEI
jgi:hypothetical protein